MSTTFKHSSEQTTNSQQGPDDDALQPVHDALCYLREFARQKPEIAALTCLGVGFFLGWKLKPW
ncbi:MAG: hypothetical protein RIC55_34305 [Pirellulaceae bacterium]